MPLRKVCFATAIALLVASAAVAQTQSLADDAASQLARKTLRDAGVAGDQLRLVTRETRTWSDSSLGCRTRGAMYTQALVTGVALRFSDDNGRRTYEVHVAGKNAVICPALNTLRRGPLRSAVSMRALSLMQDQARLDLARRLGVTANEITLESTVPASWTDAALGCTDASVAKDGAVQGYRILLQSRGEHYIYHTDLSRVLVCPPIELQ